jgi:hypothetical protein
MCLVMFDRYVISIICNLHSTSIYIAELQTSIKTSSVTQTSAVSTDPSTSDAANELSSNGMAVSSCSIANESSSKDVVFSTSVAATGSTSQKTILSTDYCSSRNTNLTTSAASNISVSHTYPVSFKLKVIAQAEQIGVQQTSYAVDIAEKTRKKHILQMVPPDWISLGQWPRIECPLQEWIRNRGEGNSSVNEILMKAHAIARDRKQNKFLARKSNWQSWIDCFVTRWQLKPFIKTANDRSLDPPCSSTDSQETCSLSGPHPRLPEIQPGSSVSKPGQSDSETLQSGT